MPVITLSQGVFNSFDGLSLETMSRVVPNQQIIIQSYSFSNYVNDALTYLENKNISITDKDKVLEFLSKYPGIVSFLYKVPFALAEFASDSQFDLRLANEMNNDYDNSQDLLLTIHTDKPLVEAKNALSSVEKKWLFPFKDSDMNLFSFSLRLN